ncbi:MULTISPECIES: sodium:solute symporter family transporter [Vibrio]|uniref:sodium:solute symporter family transporter n=1 Tax=Vibrio TaxID=662 RepID=UPI002075E499|nr:MULTISPECIES: sodium/solute symporter [Vibrio]USD31419.1 sodium/solute symporter [Vibrio sp. SCSIO 43186]USD44463.1 sodium/solute symporter [Vibrio sp. SCSIO 43145]USD68542.1 sodium/solute symporter [Vibrio sp. SCSIO 43139]USD96232.1 sodium transporter [Vibrio coralliilyticus]
MHEFGVLNWTILGGYIALTLVLGAVVGKKVTSANQFALGDKNIPWWAIGISVVCTYVSAMSFLGGPAWSYKEGLSVIAIHLNYPLVIFFIVAVFMPFFYNNGLTSIYEYQERRFGKASRVTLSFIFLIKQALSSAAVLYATAMILEFITGIDVVYCIMIVTAIALIYTVMGGIAAVIWTDVIQAVILFIGAFIIIEAVWNGMPQPMTEVMAGLKAKGMTDALQTSMDLSQVTTIWAGVIAMTMFHTTVYGGSQMMVQRCMAAKSMGDAKKAMLMMGYVAFFIYFVFILLGVLFNAYYDGKEFENGNTIILHYATEYGMPGLMGIIAAAILAASMSSLDSAFNSMATVSVADFYKRFYKKNESEEHYLKASRVFTVAWAILVIIPALMFATSTGSVLEVLSKAGSYFVGASFCMFVLGFYSKHITEKGLLIGVVASFIAIWYVAVATDIAWPWYCVIGVVVNAVVAYVASLLLTGKQQEMHLYTIKGQQAEYARLNKPVKEDGWYVIPGKIDAPCYGLLVMFVFSLVLLWGINTFTDNAPMLINFVRGCSIVVAISVVAYALYSLRGSKTVKPEQVETVE